MIIIVGAGPAGLATAYYLQKYNLPYRIVEKHSIGYSWQNHYDTLQLHTLKGVSALPGLPMPDAYPPFPNKDEVVAYLRSYAAHFDLAIDEGVEVLTATREGDGWHLQTNRGRVMADMLVVATGIWSTPHRPEWPGQVHFAGEIIHANDYQNPDAFRGKRVLVVGAGNSGAEIAAELGAAGVVTGIAIRRGMTFVRYPRTAWMAAAAARFARYAPAWLTNLLLRRLRPTFEHLGIPVHPDPPTQAYPVVGLEFPEAVAAGQVTLYPDIEHLAAHCVHFTDGRAAPFDAIILATGYKPTIGFIRPVPELDAWGRLAESCRTSHPHLYCVGFYYPATEGWLQSVGRQSHRVVQQIQRDLTR